ncbi:TLC domain-containing protein 3A [Acanthochromis polyacanthus]|uniref:TLC domain containing 3A n=1 Tax=Acanthochromis polyacanthus TaxID=80966 RepID=A0A3Q1G0F3_9TELE|nr:TLC domain-containing protein 3A [Acanthochromis polyacanthus]
MLKALLCGAAVFPGLFCSFRTILKLRQWSEKDAVVISERLVSSIHATLATAAGITVVASCRDVMTDSHWLVNWFIFFGAPYMAYDIFAMYLCHYHTQRVRGVSPAGSGHSLQSVRAFLIKDWMLVLHHAALLVVFMPVALFLRRGLGDFFIGCMFTTEFSTPFLCIGQILIQLGLDNTKLLKVNGIILLLSFFTCRILLFPFMYWMYGRQFGIPLHRVPFHLPLQCNLGNLAILSPQIYWFILLLRKANRLYLRQRRRGDEDKPKTK